jgi:hypothetical protein
MNDLPSELHNHIVTYLPERVLLNKTWRSRFLVTEPAREALFHLGLMIKICRSKRCQLVRQRRALLDALRDNLESDDPDPTYTEDSIRETVVAMDRTILDLRCKCERMNVVYTKRRASYFHNLRKSKHPPRNLLV